MGRGADNVPCFRIDVGPDLESFDAISAFRSAVAEDLKDGSDASNDDSVNFEAVYGGQELFEFDFDAQQ